MRVYLITSYFDQAGGTEESLAVLADELKKRGHQVTVFCQQAVSRQNQYVQRLMASDVLVVAWPDVVVKLVGDWYFQDRVVGGLVRVGYPILMPIALAAALVHRQPISRIWKSVVGRWQGMISHFIHQDRREVL